MNNLIFKEKGKITASYSTQLMLTHDHKVINKVDTFTQVYLMNIFTLAYNDTIPLYHETP
jgi:hypothetical protein